jgi:hypothetical protein
VTTLVKSGDMRIDSCRELANVVISSKGLIQDGVFARQNLLREDAYPRIKTLTDSLQMLRNRMMHLGILLRQSRASKSLKGEFGTLKSGVARLEKELIDLSPLHYEYVDVPANSVYSALRSQPPGTLVVDYYDFDFVHPDGKNELRYLAVVLCDTGFVACVDLGSAEAVDRQVHKYRAYLENPREAGAKLIYDATRAVCEAVWSPLEPYASGARAVFICPDGELNLISFAGLCEDESNFLIERFSVHYLSSSRDLIRHARRESEHPMRPAPPGEPSRSAAPATCP